MPKLNRLLCLASLLLIAVSGVSQTNLPAPSARKKGTPMSTTTAKGSFEVKLTKQQTEAGLPGRMSIDKQFHGDIEATSKGEMLAYMTETKGSAGYVAMEKVTGTLAGKTGSFVLQHNGTMKRGDQTLEISVVPDSGTDAFKGLEGKMSIQIEGGKHFYEFKYSLP